MYLACNSQQILLMTEPSEHDVSARHTPEGFFWILSSTKTVTFIATLIRFVNTLLVKDADKMQTSLA